MDPLGQNDGEYKRLAPRQILVLYGFLGVLISLHKSCCYIIEDTISKESEDDEVDGGKHPTSNASLRLDAVVHDSVPVLARQNLRKTGVGSTRKGLRLVQKGHLDLTECELNYFTEQRVVIE